MSQQHPYIPGPYPSMVVQPYRCSTAHVVIAWVTAVLTSLYMVPWAIAATRNRHDVGVIALVNVLLGWTVVGWVVALVMACSSSPPPGVVVYPGATAPWGAPPPPPYGWPAPAPAPATWSPSALPPPQPYAAGPEPTVIDPQPYEPTRALDHDQVWRRPEPGPYDPPPYGSEPDHRR